MDEYVGLPTISVILVRRQQAFLGSFSSLSLARSLVQNFRARTLTFQVIANAGKKKEKKEKTQ